MKFNRPKARAPQFVEALEPRLLLTSYVVTNVTDSGAGSLREGILEVNADGSTSGPDSISFSIGSGPQTITPLSPLPSITHAVILDATTQPSFAGRPLIELSGSKAGAGANGFTLQASNSTIRGFVINRFAGDGIALDEAAPNPIASGVDILSNVIQGNYIGTDPSGNTPEGNGGDGISGVLWSGYPGKAMKGNVIGGTSSGARNIISGNLGNGIFLPGGGRDDTTANLIEGNYIGTNAGGTAAIGNGKNGVELDQTFLNTIGGTTGGAGNLISGNVGNGVLISGLGGFEPELAGNAVIGNTIGLDMAGSPLGNGGAGVNLGNTLATISANSINFNAGLGIVETPPASFSIDMNPPDALPVLTALTDKSATTIIGTIKEGPNPIRPGAYVRVEFFSSPAADPSGYGQGQTYLGSTTDVTLDAAGNASFAFTTTAPLAGQVITATYATPWGLSFATSPDEPNDEFTSAFSKAVPVIDGIVVNGAADSGAGSLRQAILDTNMYSNPEVIAFNIGFGYQKIALLSPLPTIRNGLTIDATTQPGYLGMPLIELSGSGAGPTAAGLVLAADHCTVRGLVINGFSGGGVQLQGSGETIQGNYIGSDATGMVAAPNGAAGVIITSATNTVSSNVVSGNSGDGIDLQGAGAIGNMILGNRIGTTASGAAALGNSGDGILLDSGPAKNTIGGTAAAAANVISGNADGIHLRGDQTVGNLIAGNFIGTDTTGKTALPNRSNGIEVEGAQSNSIGDTTAGAGNTIAYNIASGIVVIGASATGDAILGNSVHDNQKLGIDLGGDGVTPNGPAGSSRSGPNRLQNFPVVSLAIPSSITGTLAAVANTAFRVELFSSPAADPSGFGQGQTFLGSVNVTTDSSGAGSFSFTPGASLAVGQFVTATATDPAGNTSEFSAARVVLPSAPPRVTAAVFDYSHSFPTLTFTFSKSVTASVVASGLGTITVQDLTTGTSISPAFFSYNGTNNTVLYTFPGPLPDGNYRATLLASAISDSDGNHLDGKGDNVPGQDYNFPFLFLRGDINHDGTVDFADLVALARNYGKQNATWSDGDFNYDGSVGFDDLVILGRNYGRTVSSAGQTASPFATPAFGTRPSAAMEYALSAVPIPRRLAHIRTRHLSLI